MFSFPVSALGDGTPGYLVITGLNDENGRPIDKVKVELYCVTNMEPVKENFVFNEMDTEDIIKLTKELETYVYKNNVNPNFIKSSESGRIDINGIRDGLYLVVFKQNNKDIEIMPALISFPYCRDGNKNEYYLNIEPKIDYHVPKKPVDEKVKKPFKVKTDDPYKVIIYFGLLTFSAGMVLLLRNDLKEVSS